MTRARTTYDRFPLFDLHCEPLSEDERRQLKKICPDPEFVREFERLAAIYRRLYKCGEPADRDVLETLKDLKRTTNALHKKISGLPLRVNGLLLREGPDRFALSWLLAALAKLNHLNSSAVAKLKPQAGRRPNALGRQAATTVRELFQAHGVQPKPANLTFCLQLMLGTPDRRVDRALK